jgi:hypothetical protein
MLVRSVMHSVPQWVHQYITPKSTSISIEFWRFEKKRCLKFIDIEVELKGCYLKDTLVFIEEEDGV